VTTLHSQFSRWSRAPDAWQKGTPDITSRAIRVPSGPPDSRSGRNAPRGSTAATCYQRRDTCTSGVRREGPPAEDTAPGGSVAREKYLREGR